MLSQCADMLKGPAVRWCGVPFWQLRVVSVAQHIEFQYLSFGNADKSHQIIGDSGLACDVLMARSAGGVHYQHEGESDKI